MREVTTTLGEEFDRLDARLSDLSGLIVDGDDDRAQSRLHSEARDTEQALSGLAYLIHGDDDLDFGGYGTDATVTLQGLSAKEYARVDDRVAAIRAARDKPGGVPGSSSNVYAAMVLVDAPFIDDGALSDAADPLDVKLSAVAAQPAGVVSWLETRGDDLTTVAEGNFKPLNERLADRATDN